MKVEIPLMLRAKLGEPPFYNGIFTDFAPTLHRLWYGGRALSLHRLRKRYDNLCLVRPDSLPLL